MSDTIDSGGPAFPGQPWPDRVGVYEKAPGMTLRDWFAGQALAGIAANSNGIFIGGEIRHDTPAYARVAYEIADAMLAERKNGGAA